MSALPHRNRDEWARRGLLWAAVGILVAQPLVSLVEAVASWPGPAWSAVVFCVVIGPAVAIPAGLFASRRAPPTAQPHWKWIVLAVAVMGGWSLAYFALGALSEGRGMVRLHTPLDDLIPLWTPSIWIYLTYFWLMITPYLYPGRLTLRRAALANLAMLTVVGCAFLAMPVVMDRPVVGDATLSRYALSILQASDPAHNCFPSLHCANALLAGLLLRETGTRFWPLGVGYALLIAATTLTTKQHWVADVGAGLAAAVVVWLVVFRPWRARAGPS